MRQMVCVLVLLAGQVSIVAADGLSRVPCTVRFRVVDEAGSPVSNAYVHGSSDWAGDRRKGYTDGNGMHSYPDKVHLDVSCLVKKEGYYESRGGVWERRLVGDYPTNTLTVVLKRIVDPVPMEFHEMETYLPRLDAPVGFDIAVGDWVAPDGKGEMVDIWMTGTMRFESRIDHEIRVQATFPNVLDGIQDFVAVKPDDMRLASRLMAPHLAPLDDYERACSLWQLSRPGGSLQEHDRKDRNYLFRIRTRMDEKGAITAANYGWTYGEIAVDSEDGKRIWMRLRYYFNPDPHSRSLEPKSIADQQNREEP